MKMTDFLDRQPPTDLDVVPLASVVWRAASSAQLFSKQYTYHMYVGELLAVVEGRPVYS